MIIYANGKREHFTTHEEKEEQKKNTSFKSGLKNSIYVGYDFGSGANKINRLNLQYKLNYQINSILSTGIGLGLKYYNVENIAYDSGPLLIPIYANIYFDSFFENLINPYADLSFGYSFYASPNYFKGGGIILHPSLGISFKTSETTNMTFGLGYEFQKLHEIGNSNFSYYYSNSEDAEYVRSDNTFNIHAITLKLGIVF